MPILSFEIIALKGLAYRRNLATGETLRCTDPDTLELWVALQALKAGEAVQKAPLSGRG